MTEQLFAGVDVGGTATKIAIGTADGRIAAERRIPTRSQDGSDVLLARIADEVAAVSREAGLAPSALGIGLPGTIDLRAGVTKHLSNFPGHWRDVPVRDLLSGKVGCPVHVLNDVRAATLGELHYGLGRTANSLIFLALGTGLGGGVVIDRKLRLGPIGAAGELGHMIVEPNGRTCGCGSRGCLETYVSGPALSGEGVRLLRSGQAPHLFEITGGDPGQVDPLTLERAAREGDTKIRQAIGHAAEILGVAISNLVMALHPDLVVIGGGIGGMADDLLYEPLRRTVRDTVRVFPTDRVRIERSALGNRAGVLGAIALAARGGVLDFLDPEPAEANPKA